MLRLFERQFVIAARAEELENRHDGLVICSVLIVRPSQRSCLDGTASPLQKTAHLALQAGARNIGTLGQRMADHGIVNAADMHFSIAAADVSFIQFS